MPINASAGRREFLGQLATAAVAIAGTACAGATAQSAPAPAAPVPATPGPTNGATPAPRRWSDVWVSRITGKHKAVFDAPEIADGAVISNAWVWMKGFKDVYGVADSDLSPVLVIRHAAIAMAFDDEMWAKYEIGKHEKIKDFVTSKWATRNPYYKPTPSEKTNEFTLEALEKRGAILMACDLAAGGFSGRIARRTKQPPRTVREEMNAHLLTGLTLAPSGIFATMRAQEAGCAFMRSV
jgi:hypothetical protein